MVGALKKLAHAGRGDSEPLGDLPTDKAGSTQP